MDDPEARGVASGNTLCTDGSLCQVEVEFAALVTVHAEGIRMAALALSVGFGGIRSVLEYPQRCVGLGRTQGSVHKVLLLVTGQADLLLRYYCKSAGLMADQAIGDALILMALV